MQARTLAAANVESIHRPPYREQRLGLSFFFYIFVVFVAKKQCYASILGYTRLSKMPGPLARIHGMDPLVWIAAHLAPMPVLPLRYGTALPSTTSKPLNA